MHAIDWDSPEVQRVYMQLTSGEQAEYDAGLERLREALDALPDPSWRQMAAMWLSDAYWRVRDALQTVRLYP